MRKVTFIEQTVFNGVLPLVSGYLQACVQKDPTLAAEYGFEHQSLHVSTPFESVLQGLVDSRADVYAFSCYVWNMRKVRALVAALRERRPDAYFILGGPQVMHQGARYLSQRDERTVVCNGEGERTFTHFLRALDREHPILTGVRGLSFYLDGELVTTEDEPRIADLSEIPSPFLEGVFPRNKYIWTVIETNRGCPFKCNYCYWGAATGARVYKYNEDRIRDELKWISESGGLYLYIADANWGMLKRDVELSRFLAECGKKNGMPRSVHFCGSKNTPERVGEISALFHEAGMVATQSIALQTMSDEALERVNRENIRTSAYTQLQQTLNQKGISSFVEMIWPLPGETLESFETGLAQLCEIGAGSFSVYPLILMNNVELNQHRVAYELETVPDPDPNSEAEMVIATKQVSRSDYIEGLRFAQALSSLHEARGLWALGRYLKDRGVIGYVDLFRAFVRFSDRLPESPYTQYCRQVLSHFDFDFDHVGGLLHLVLHAERESFDALLHQFVREHGFVDTPETQLLFEVDILNRPYIYNNTRIVPKKHTFEHIRVIETTTRGYNVEVPARFWSLIEQFAEVPRGRDKSGRFEIRHRVKQMPFMPAKPLKDSYFYCRDIAQKIGSILAIWNELPAEATPIARSV
jgi:tRNA A37 methylthiotransferase MiaB